MERRVIAITPQRMHLDAQIATVRAALLADQSWLVAEGLPKMEGILSPEALILVWQGPEGFAYRTVAGPLAGAWEELHLVPAAAGTDVTLEAEFVAAAGSDHRRLRLQLEHTARMQLLALIELVERREGRTDTLRRLLAAVSAQEIAEWGDAGHSTGVERVAVALGEAMLLPERQIAYLSQAAQLHDVGKIALDSALWSGRGTLLSSHRRAMETHPQLGYTLAARAGLPEPVLQAIRHHHERWDGRGYPSALVAEAIPLKARILFLAESIDAMRRPRTGRVGLDNARILERLLKGAGSEWDPQLARLAARLMHRADAPLVGIGAS